MKSSTAMQASSETPRSAGKLNLKVLVGSGERIGLFVLPFVIAGVALSFLAPTLMSVGGPPPALKMLSIVVLVPGVTMWVWSVALILTRVPKHELITGGPFSLVKHPLYTSVALLVLPWVGFLLDTWLGVVLGVALYVASRRYAPEEEEALARSFGPKWDAYSESVKIPWL